MSEVPVVKRLLPMPLLHVCVSAGRRTEEGLMEVADGGDGTDAADGSVGGDGGETLWLLPLLHVWVGAGRRTEE